MTLGRLFVAVDPPASVRAELARWARWALEPGASGSSGGKGGPGGPGGPGGQRIPAGSRSRPGRAPTDGIRRVDARALHITLCFLGDQPLDLVDEIEEIVRGATTGLALAGLSIGPLGIGAPVWLPPRRPRALALQVHDESGGLTALYDDLRRGLGGAIGWEPERRRLRPHITVARLRSWAPPPACGEPTPALVFEPESVTLYRSRLEPDGAVYQPLARVGHGGRVGTIESPDVEGFSR
jgi:RNA 2',3'-cyclic 3'-phosphodiesterase